jgi:hypothetical protein
MLLATLFQRLTRCFKRNQESRSRSRTRRGKRPAPSRHFVPQFTVLEDRSLPSVAHAPVANILPPSTPAIPASHVISASPKTGETTVDLTGTISSGHAGQLTGPTNASALSQAETQVLPFKVTGGRNAPQGLPVFPTGTAPHDATGTATYLGKYTGQGVFTLDSIDLSTLTGTFHGTFTFVAANGDQLVMSYGTVTPGTFSLTPQADGTVVATFVAVFTPVPDASTGRFANVTGGSFTMVATTEPFVLSVNDQGYTPSFTYTWVGQGTLEFAMGKH